MVAILHKHETPAGILTVMIEYPESSDYPLVRLEFECVETGAMFDATYSHSDLCEICPIFGELDELMDTLCELPTINMSEAKDIVTARFMVRGRKREYPANLKISRRIYESDKKDAIELRAENAVLRRRLVTVEDQVNKLALIMLVSTYPEPGECKELLKMIKSPLDTLEQISSQEMLIIICADQQDTLAWFKSLNPDLRRFRQLKSDECGLSRVVGSVDPESGPELVEFIRYLISIHVDINHVHKKLCYGGIYCSICYFNDKNHDAPSWYDHRCTPLDATRGHIRELSKADSNQKYDPIIRANMMKYLREIEGILIDAGAKSHADL